MQWHAHTPSAHGSPWGRPSTLPPEGPGLLPAEPQAAPASQSEACGLLRAPALLAQPHGRPEQAWPESRPQPSEAAPLTHRPHMVPPAPSVTPGRRRGSLRSPSAGLARASGAVPGSCQHHQREVMTPRAQVVQLTKQVRPPLETSHPPKTPAGFRKPFLKPGIATQQHLSPPALGWVGDLLA